MLIDEQYIEDDIVYNMKNYSLKNGDKIMAVGSGNICTIGKDCNTDKSGKYVINYVNVEYSCNRFVLASRINKDNYWHYYYSNSGIWRLLEDYSKINNNHIHICKEQQILGIKNRIQNIVEYGLMEYVFYIYNSKQCLHYNHSYSRYKKECEELNISQYYYHDIENNKLIPFNSEKEYYEFINGKDN